MLLNSYKPLLYFLSYVYFSLALSVFGPIEYRDYNSSLVLSYVSLFLLFFTVAYVLGIKLSGTYRVQSFNSINYFFVLVVVKCSIIITAIYSLYLLVNFFWGGNSVSISGAGEAYFKLYADYQRGQRGYSVSYIVSVFIKVPFLITLIMGSYYFKGLKSKYKYLIIFVILTELLINTLGSGKNKQLGDIVIFVSSILLIKLYSVDFLKKNNVKKYKIYILFMGFFGVISILYLFYLRYEAIGITAENINDKAHPLISFDLESIVFSTDLGLPIAILSGYLTQGWYGLSLAMQLPFEWTYLFGNSYSLMVIYEKFLGGESLLASSYPYRVGSVFDWGESKWHSWFTWFASDFSFSGVLFLAFPMGYIYAVAWKESIFYSNPISIFMFALLSLGLVFLPANNQLLHTPEGLLVFILAMFFWLFARKRFNFDRIYFYK